MSEWIGAGPYKLYDDYSGEAQRIAEMLRKAEIPFEIVNKRGKVQTELLIGNPAFPENWLTGEEAIKKWIKEIKKSKRQG